MTDRRHQLHSGDVYLEHLSDPDLDLLAGAVRGGMPGGARDLRARPELVEELLAEPSVLDRVLSPHPDDERLVAVSPFLVFAAAVNRTADELRRDRSFSEWLGPRRRVPVLGTDDLVEFLADPWRRLFLAELLASFTRVASGSVFVRSGRRFRRQRFSELDPVQLASLLEVVPAAEQPGVYRRLGDLSLFLTGVFPDHTAVHGFSPSEESRLLRAGRLPATWALQGGSLPEAVAPSGAVGLLAELGKRWYRLAYRTGSEPGTRALRSVRDLADRYDSARRVLNVATERHLLPSRHRWFGVGA